MATYIEVLPPALVELLMIVQGRIYVANEYPTFSRTLLSKARLCCGKAHILTMYIDVAYFTVKKFEYCVLHSHLLYHTA